MDYDAYHRMKVAAAEKAGKKAPSAAMTKNWFKARDSDGDSRLTGSETAGLGEYDFLKMLKDLGRNDVLKQDAGAWAANRDRFLKKSQRGLNPIYATVVERTDPRDPGRLVLSARQKDGTRLPVRRKIGGGEV